MLGIIIGIAAVMTIVSAINGYTEKTMEQYEAMGCNKLTVSIYSYAYVVDEDGNTVSSAKDYFPGSVRLLQDHPGVCGGRDAQRLAATATWSTAPRTAPILSTH